MANHQLSLHFLTIYIGVVLNLFRSGKMPQDTMSQDIAQFMPPSGINMNINPAHLSGGWFSGITKQ